MYREGHGYSALRRGRVSVPDATYFVTMCIRGHPPKGGCADAAQAIEDELIAMEKDDAVILRAVTVMPGHVHLLFRLKKRLAFSRVIARLKSKTRTVLARWDLKWQENLFERRLRPDEAVLPIFHYIFMNPYRAGLLMRSEKWPHFRCGSEDWVWFQDHLDKECPYPEWLADR